MSLLSAILFALSANIDAFLLGLSYSFKGQRLALSHNLCISGITLLGTLASLVFGSWIAAFFPEWFSSMAGGLLLLFLGLYYCLRFFYTLLHPNFLHTSSCEPTPPRAPGWMEISLSGLALSLNNMCMGIGASFAGLSIPLVCGLTFLFCLVLVSAGNHLGFHHRFLAFSRYGNLLSGLLLVVLGGWPLVLLLVTL
jgi:putative Mn2+ efflux pump MntP